MKILDILYEEAMGKPELTDSKDYIKATKKLSAFLNEIPLSRKELIQIEDLALETQVVAERQGFESGFKYAMSLIKECGL